MVLVLYQLAGLTAELPSIHGICQRFPPCIYFDTKDMLAKDFFSPGCQPVQPHLNH